MQMKKRKNNYKSAGSRVNGKSSPTEYPESRRKRDHIYMEGAITYHAHGKYKVLLDNGMDCISTANKLDFLKVNLLIGDRVLIEIPTSGLSPDGKYKVQGRIVYRFRQSNS
jgi:translation initiation factor IF-1